MAQPRKTCPFCNRPMVLKGELKDATKGTCVCVDDSKCRNIKIMIDEDDFIYWEMYE